MLFFLKFPKNFTNLPEKNHRFVANYEYVCIIFLCVSGEKLVNSLFSSRFTKAPHNSFSIQSKQILTLSWVARNLNDFVCISHQIKHLIALMLTMKWTAHFKFARSRETFRNWPLFLTQFTMFISKLREHRFWNFFNFPPFIIIFKKICPFVLKNHGRHFWCIIGVQTQNHLSCTKIVVFGDVYVTQIYFVPV